MSSFNEREAARQQLKKQLETAPKEEGNARFNANWSVSYTHLTLPTTPYV